jgi:hypothetical protein
VDFCATVEGLKRTNRINPLEKNMQQLLVLIAIAVAVFFIAKRIWKTLIHPKNFSCGCGCSGCGSVASTLKSKATFPAYKP